MGKHIRMCVLAPLAAAAVQCSAQEATQLYGVLDLWAGRSAISAGGPAVNAVNSGGMTTSYWGWSGSDSLGGGMKAIFAVEGYLQLDNGMAGRTATDAMFARNAFVGVQGAAGEIKIGRVLNPLFVATAQSNPFGGSIRFAPLLAQVWSPTMGRAVSGDTSWDNVVSYTTPVVMGIKAAAYVGLGETAFGTETNNTGITVNYSAGPFVAWVTAQLARVGPGLAAIGRSRQSTYFAGGSYDFGSVKLFASFDTADSRAPGITARTGQAGVSVPVGAGAILLSWARTNNALDAAPGFRRDTGAAGYDYFLSKRTDLYAVVQADRLSTASTAKTYGAGIRHRF